MNVFIMCQGEQKRLASLGYPKHLLVVGVETILGRTIRLAREFEPGAEVTVVGYPSHAVAANGAVRLVELLNPGFCVLDGVEGVLAKRPSGRHVFLLGDVVWSRAALSELLRYEGAIAFSGTTVLTPSQGEVFGCSFVDPTALREILATAPCRFRPADGHRIQYPKMQGGHLRRLFWHAQERGPVVYFAVKDFTDDVDEVGDLARLPDLARAVAEDDGL